MRISDWSSDVCSSDLSRRDFGRSGKSPSQKGLASACEALSSSALVTKGSPIGLPGSRGKPLSYDNRPMLGDVERDRARVGLYHRDGPPRMRAAISDKIRFETAFFAKLVDPPGIMVREIETGGRFAGAACPVGSDHGHLDRKSTRL